MRWIRRQVAREHLVFVLTATWVAVVFVLTDHRRDFVGMAATSTGDGPPGLVIGTTIARLSLLGFVLLLVWFGPRPVRPLGRAHRFALGAFVVYLGLTTLWSPDPTFTLRKLIVIATVAVTALCIAQVFDRGRITDLILAVFGAYLVLGIIYEVASGSVRFLSVYRFAGTTGANQNGVYAAVIALIAGNRLLSGSSPRWVRATHWLLLVLAVSITAVTISRTAMVAFVAAAVVAGWFRVTATTVSLRRRLGLSLGVSALVGVFALVVLTNHRSSNLSSISLRSPIWERLWNAVLERPIHGHGYLGYWVSGSRNRVEDAHSVYLDLLLDGGFIALALFLIPLWLTLRSLIAAVRERPDADTIFFVCFVVFALVHGVAESQFIRPSIALFFLACVVLQVAIDAADNVGPDNASTDDAEPTRLEHERNSVAA